MKLPDMKYSDRIMKVTQDKFRGLQTREGAKDGDISDMLNMTSDSFPLLSSRRARYKLYKTTGNPNGIYASDRLFIMDGTTLKVAELPLTYTGAALNTRSVGTLSDSVKSFATINEYVVILPDKVYFKSTRGLYATKAALEAAVTKPNKGDEYTVGTTAPYWIYKWSGNEWVKHMPEVGRLEGTYTLYGWDGGLYTATFLSMFSETEHGAAQAEALAIAKTNELDCFFVKNMFYKKAGGTAIKVTAVTNYPAERFFSEGIDEESEEDDYYYWTAKIDVTIEEGGNPLSLSRYMPDLDYFCENDNRLFGCKGDDIYTCKQGDPFSWDTYAGISTDSYWVDVGSASGFTGCAAYAGKPMFFKEDIGYILYGDVPSEYTLKGQLMMGVENGSGSSLAIVNDYLFFNTRKGIYAYGGGSPEWISEDLGERDYSDAVAGSDGTKYYISAKNTTGTYTLLVYDTRRGIWTMEDHNKKFVAFAWQEELYGLDSAGDLWLMGNFRGYPAGAAAEAAVTSCAVFAPFVENNVDKKHTHRLHMRFELAYCASVTVYISYDGGTYTAVKTISDTGLTNYYIPVPVKRCDRYQIKIAGTGGWKLHTLAREYKIGSAK